VPQKRNNNADQQDADIQNLEQDRRKRNKEINASRFKRCKIDESKSIDDTFTNISNAIINLIESTKENTTYNIKTIDQSFADYIRVHLENIPEPEKSERKKMIIDALTKPLPKS